MIDDIVLVIQALLESLCFRVIQVRRLKDGENVSLICSRVKVLRKVFSHERTSRGEVTLKVGIVSQFNALEEPRYLWNLLSAVEFYFHAIQIVRAFILGQRRFG